ncbi:M56 family metallopeptidase [Leucobacter luti]|uniref:M56 family metallopeptidase n=1 Tax=Leucobacter luti TaxID=340320 RepID=UPI003D00C32E
MTTIALTLGLSGILAIAAIGAPALLRRAAPALAAAPRAARRSSAGALLWIGAFVALGPVVAWMSSGPAWLPAALTEVCDRCLSAASPFGQSAVSLGIPAFVPLALPLIGLAAILLGIARELAALARSRRAAALALASGATPARILGHDVLVTPDPALSAYSLPGRIVVSRGMIAALSTPELAAVLAHEAAHVAQRHHVMLALLNGATRYFRWVPLVGAVRGSVPHYLEIAADRAAGSATSTAALASALLRLGSAGAPAFRADAAVALGAALDPAALAAAGSGAGAGSGTGSGSGTARVRSLIGQPRPRASTALAAAAAAYALMLAAAIVAVQAPYLLAILTGC